MTRLAINMISRDVARRLGDRDNEAAALGNLGNSAARSAPVRGSYQRAPRCGRDLPGDQRSVSRGHCADQPQRRAAADAPVRGGDHRAQDAATIFRETGDRHGEGGALTNLGGALQEVGRFEEAITAHQDAAAIFRETGDRHSEGLALNNLGSALQEVRRFEEAITALQDAAAIFRETGDRHGEGTALTNLGSALRGGGPVRGGDHRAPGRGGDLPGDRRPARRGRRR